MSASEISKAVVSLDLDTGELPHEHPLEVGWNSGDTFVFVILKGISKRDLLSLTFKIFSPMGILNFTIVYAKQLVQETCRRKLGWDNLLTYLINGTCGAKIFQI